MSDPISFRDLRKLADMEGRRAMYEKGEQIGHPCYSRTGPRGTDEWTCPGCKETIHRDHSNGTAFRPCKCLNQVYHNARLATRDEHRSEVLGAELRRCGVPSLYLQASFENFEPRPGTEDALRICREYAGDFEGATPTGLYLFGPPGTGKTHLACAILRTVMQAVDIEPVFVEAVHLLQETRTKRDEDPMDRCIKAPLLVLDDLGNHGVTPYAQEQLYRLLSARYTSKRPVIITTNCTGNRLKDLLGSALRSRLNQMCTGVKIEAPDFRMPGAEATDQTTDDHGFDSAQG